MTPTFTIDGMRYEPAFGALVIHVDSARFDRAYIVEWRPDRDSLVVVRHWRDDCIDSTDALPMDEAYELYLFLDANDDVAGAWAEAWPERRAG